MEQPFPPGPDAADGAGEGPVAGGSSGPRYVLRLYVSGTTARSVRAIANMRRICDTELKDRYDLDVVDVYQNPAATRDHQVIVVPTLVRLLPAPPRRLIGDLSDRARVLAGLDIAVAAKVRPAG